MASEVPSSAPVRFSLQIASVGSRREWIDLVKRADDCGFDMIVTGDHLEQCLAPLVPLATAAEVSDRLRLGVMVLNNDFHHPSLLARDLATLDLLSDGRVEVGIGAGHSKPEYERAGLHFDGAATRVDRLEEAVIVLRQLLGGETVTFAGDHYRLTDERCEPSPVQAHVPLLVGGAGRRVHAIAARHADEDVAALAVAAAGRSVPLELQALVQAVVVTDDAIGVAAQIAAKHMPALTAADILDTPYVMVGSAGSIVDKLLEHRERWGFTHYTVRREALDHLEPVIEALSR